MQHLAIQLIWNAFLSLSLQYVHDEPDQDLVLLSQEFLQLVLDPILHKLEALDLCRIHKAVQNRIKLLLLFQLLHELSISLQRQHCTC